jgi:hypothetical protein
MRRRGSALMREEDDGLLSRILLWKKTPYTREKEMRRFSRNADDAAVGRYNLWLFATDLDMFV